MKKILFVLLCILSFAGGITTIYFAKSSLATSKVDDAYAAYEATTFDTSNFNEEEIAAFTILQETIEKAKTEKNIEELDTAISSIHQLVKRSNDRIENDYKNTFENLRNELNALAVPERANDWERGEFDRVRAEAQALFDSGAPNDQITAKMDELKGLINNINTWIADEGGREPADTTPSNDDNNSNEE